MRRRQFRASASRQYHHRRTGLLPLPVRDERGEGWGEGHKIACTKARRKQDGPPLPSPLLPRREERENSHDGRILSRCARSGPRLIQETLRIVGADVRRLTILKIARSQPPYSLRRLLQLLESAARSGLPS